MTAAQARPRLGRAGPCLWRPRAAAAAPRRSAAPAARRAAPTTAARQPPNRPGRGAIASGRSRHRSRAPRRGQLGRARPAGPGRRRGRGRRRVNFFRAASALALRARSGRRRERAAACFFGWVPGPAPAGRASARKIKIRGAYSTPYTGRRPRRRLHGALRLQQHRRGWGGFGGEEALASPSPPISRSAK